ncbi:hypothetical protein C1645_766326 [Glomus cerebriforme]|uniref:Uncharacterized protein n=1 Tax=Glomus cerebriforme TaxID=658196 RepID=A0A397T0R2_9GLOM|nr:hypothetical protein C1645_766326 [Glomus cerebriforme]
MNITFLIFVALFISVLGELVKGQNQTVTTTYVITITPTVTTSPTSIDTGKKGIIKQTFILKRKVFPFDLLKKKFQSSK